MYSKENEENNDINSYNNQNYNISPIEYESLAFNSKLLLNVNMPRPKKLSQDETSQVKFSIDLPTASQSKIHEYLNSDLIEELDKEPEDLNEPELKQFENRPNFVPFHINIPDKKYPFNKLKKPFEIREGDWTCFECQNLNFSFRTKCNRCGLSKEISQSKLFQVNKEMMYNPNYLNNLSYYDYFHYNLSDNQNNISKFNNTKA